MPLTPEQLEVEARGLPREERARLAQALISSLDEESSLERAWFEEAERRAAELDSDTVKAIPAHEALAELDALLRE